jgi:hypothetical protein
MLENQNINCEIIIIHGSPIFMDIVDSNKPQN